ncbi:hypothetical protein AB833_18815 [Chromatiales bacterium (ex Bugula neritina AB1)]|nr:hypothetical protein AB833_18815 [Chromatiales bacterium (ex Bugula neritina AB1)]
MEVLIDTSLGEIGLVLDASQTPVTVENFLSYVDDGHYDGTIFHRVIAGFMIQGGGYTETFEKKPTEAPIANEAANGQSNDAYTIAMARTSDPHSAAAQFFINAVDNSFLNHNEQSPGAWGYAVFGTVTTGHAVVDQIAASATGASGPFQSDVPVQPVVINSINRIP